MPRVLLDGDEAKIESLTELAERRGFWEIRQPCLEVRRPRTRRRGARASLLSCVAS